jgi:CRISPR-associated protein Cmr1
VPIQLKNFVRLTADFRLLTPLFLGGAEQKPELRPPSLKGALRFWYRAIDPGFGALVAGPEAGGSLPRRECVLFGAAGVERGGTGQARVLLDVRADGLKKMGWPDVSGFSVGQGKRTRNGLIYLGFPFQRPARGADPREAFAPGQTFRVELCLPRPLPGADSTILRRGLLASLWLLGHLGSLGSRSRRGFGSVVLESWDLAAGEEGWRQDMQSLPLLHRTPNGPAWCEGALRTLQTLREWFGTTDANARHPHVPAAPRLVVTDPGVSVGEKAWMQALNAGGRHLQDRRAYSQPDHDAVLDHINGRRRLSAAPERASFGLPLTFRYSSTPQTMTFVPSDPEAERRNAERDRHPSLLWLRLVRCGDGLHPLFHLLGGARPGFDPPVRIQRGAAVGRASADAVDRFLRQLETEAR